MKILPIVLVLFLSSSLHAQMAENEKEFEVRVTRGIEYVYNLEFEKADAEFQYLVHLKPLDPAGHFFLAMVQWWRILIDIDNEQYDDQFHDALDHVIDLADAMLEKDPGDVHALFFKGGAIGFQGRLSTHRSQWLAAANAGRKALPIVQEASSLDPNNHDILLGTGIYNYYAEVIPTEYPFVQPLLLFVPKGDKKKGIEQLTRASQQGKYASVEATYFLMQLYYQFEKNYSTALELATRLHQRFPNNMLFHKYLGRSYVSLGRWDDCGRVFEEISARCRNNQRGYGASTEREAEYYLGMYDMIQKRLDGALSHFYRVDELSRRLDSDEPSGFMVMTNLKLGNIYDMQSRRDLAVAQYKKVLDMKEYKDSFKQAEMYLKTPYAQ